jgi:UDP-N-acetylmuramate dehydrogenase
VPLTYSSSVPLAPRTTLQLGGAARRFVEASSEAEIVEAVSSADRRGEPLLVLGGGSNLVVGDEGFDGLVVAVKSRGVREVDSGTFDVEAGEPWDELVERWVRLGFSGVECLSGIPGLAGATPIQNVGAYGQEVKDVLVSVRVWDRRAREVRELPASGCALAYRHSRFKEEPEHFVVLGARFLLARSDHSSPIRYAELARALGLREGDTAPAARVRETVLALRRGKGMVLDAADTDTRSAGSFFMNPIVESKQADAVDARARARLGGDVRVPRFPGDREGTVKLAAAWLIEKAGFPKGFALGSAAISSKHSLALVSRGTSSSDLLALARMVRDGVEAAFGVRLVPEPVLVGCTL